MMRLLIHVEGQTKSFETTWYRKDTIPSAPGSPADSEYPVGSEVGPP